MHGIRYKLYLIENYDDDTNDDNDDNDDDNDHYSCNSVTRSLKAHLSNYFFKQKNLPQVFSKDFKSSIFEVKGFSKLNL